MIDICFWCNRAKGGVDGDPMYNGYDFCKECLKETRRGITVIQVTEITNNNPPILDGLHPTGKWAVVSEENVKIALEGSPILEKILETRKMYVNQRDWESLKLP